MTATGETMPQCGCLECRLRATIDAYYAENGRPDPAAAGGYLVDAAEVIAKLQTIAGEMVSGLPDRGQRRASLKFAHDALDAGVRAARFKTLVPVEFESAREH